MATPYTTIYDRFDGKVTDYELDALDPADKEEVKERLLKSAIARFSFCRNTLEIDDVAKEFVGDLLEIEIQILASFMVMEWIRPFKNDLDYLQDYLISKEFHSYSPANKLRELNASFNNIKKDVKDYVVQYSYTGQIGGLGR